MEGGRNGGREEWGWREEWREGGMGLEGGRGSWKGGGGDNGGKGERKAGRKGGEWGDLVVIQTSLVLTKYGIVCCDQGEM